MIWAMAMAMRLVAREGCKGNGNGDVRVVGNKESKGSKAMVIAMATRRAGEWSAMATKRLMAMVTRVVGKQRRWQ